MCDEIIEGEDVIETILDAREKGWLPVITILAKVEAESIEDPSHLHYLWNTPPEVAIAMAMRFIAEMRLAMIEEDARRVREN